MHKSHVPFLFAVVAILSLNAGSHDAVARDAATLSDQVQELWNKLRGSEPLPGIATSNGRIEAQQVLVSAKFAGRVADVLVEEGQIVDAGAVIARMDTSELDAQLSGAEAEVRRSETGVATAEATIAQRGSELTLARLELERASDLSATGSGTRQQLDLRRSQLAVAEAVSRSALASRDEAQAGLDAARAEVARVRSQLDDAILKAPRRGRVEYKLVQSGEVVAAGAPIATLLDLTDVYMTVFLPARAAGRLAFGDEARIILDPAPGYVVPATISFVAAEAQFTPKTVETEDEREKLMFRVKLRIASGLLKQYETRVKTGVRGVGYVRTDPAAAWPPQLAVKLPQ
ncbi:MULTISPECIES: HlyD family efflux transporter periplasmic adaptor subunit [unclassified Rhizobium]|uniref:HlyD family secretion protein n=1 Tax=Rhizobium TaxID=379 RepID=UPI00084BE9BB|nr:MULTISPECIES: HlyD family efflux transporter periplasmic adaptor subunit [unclassified Rhizobium]OEC95657.1 efflux transporter periplasmic adaptor subunit [Rhizobium sp. YK2]QYA15273.1 HlyD family efflux transporter periplasmic adaptor subunit [Rhizobium sp. AB2/73]UEQ83860.1 HlyD family efflux transporter periplasmic adaptor subunit [Rhizobium sp. AB2/73]